MNFSNVLIKPQFSTITSRKDVKLIDTYHFKNSNTKWTGIPIISSNMTTVSNFQTLPVMARNNLLTCLPKHLNQTLIEYIPSEVYLFSENIILSCGSSNKDIDLLQRVLKHLERNNIHIKFICMDVANGYVNKFHEACRTVRNMYPDKIIIAGNVVTKEGVQLLADTGVDMVKIGIGNGSVCITRNKTGVGVPQLTAVYECSKMAKEYGVKIISDGGVNQPGDFAKAYVGGADFVMSGSIFSGHKENSTDIYTKDGVQYTSYYGMASKKAVDQHFGGLKDYRAAEGKEIDIIYKGELKDTIKDLLGGLRSTCTYLGKNKLSNIVSNGELIILN